MRRINRHFKIIAIYTYFESIHHWWHQWSQNDLWSFFQRVSRWVLIVPDDRYRYQSISSAGINCGFLHQHKYQLLQRPDIGTHGNHVDRYWNAWVIIITELAENTLGTFTEFIFFGKFFPYIINNVFGMWICFGKDQCLRDFKEPILIYFLWNIAGTFFSCPDNGVGWCWDLQSLYPVTCRCIRFLHLHFPKIFFGWADLFCSHFRPWRFYSLLVIFLFR